MIPNAPKEYTGFDGTSNRISDNAALEEFKLQTGTSPLKLYWSNKSATATEGTVIFAVPVEAAPKVPPWIYFFGRNLRIKRKLFRPRVQQCTRCWDFHNQRTCTRVPKCRLCGAKDHTEETHPRPDLGKKESFRCANCCGPFAADHPGCLVRPSLAQGAITRKSKTQIAAIRRSGANQRQKEETRMARETNQSTTPTTSDTTSSPPSTHPSTPGKTSPTRIPSQTPDQTKEL